RMSAAPACNPPWERSLRRPSRPPRVLKTFPGVPVMIPWSDATEVIRKDPMKTFTAVLSAFLLAMGGINSSAAPEDELAKKLRETWGSAGDWLGSQQDESGAWKSGPADKAAPSPSFTGLVLAAFGGAPAPLKAKYKASADKAVNYLLSKINADGSVGE